MQTFRLAQHALSLAMLLLVVALTTASAEDKPPPRTMRVQVLGPGGKPLKGAKVHAAIWAKDPLKGNLDYICDAEGKVSVALPKEVQILRLWGSLDGHVALFANWGSGTDDVLPSLPEEYTFRLEKGTLIGGIVKNEDGEPIPGAKVEVMLVDRPALVERPVPNTWLATEDAALVTDAKGRWTLNNVPAGDDVQIKVMLTHPRYLSESEWGTLQKEQDVKMTAFRDQTAVLVMHNGIPLSGTVVDATGKGVAGAVVVWGNDPYFTRGSQEVFTDAKGRFQFPPIPLGPTNVTVVAPGWSPEQREIDVGRPDNGSIQFELHPGKKLRIRFVDHEGKVVPEVFVGINRWRGNQALYNHKHPNVVETKVPRQADKDGVYEWNWAPADEVEFSFFKEGYMQNKKKIVPSDDDEFVVKMIK
jgi:uncharacterized GH25 family protein